MKKSTVLSLNVRMGLSEESWSLQGFHTVSLLLADVQLDKVLLFFSVKKSEFY